MTSPILSVYRIYLRQIRQLPHLYLRQFFRVKAEDDVRRVLQTQPGCRFNTRLKNISKDICKLQDALHGDTKAFAHILDLAYGRKGKLRWELMQPLMNNPQGPRPPPIIHSIEKSRPPAYSPELTALMTSAFSRTTKPLTAKALEFPPILPARARPDSEEARLLGPFSKRREVNTRWRYFSEQCKKVLPPLKIPKPKQTKELDVRTDMHDFGFNNTGITEDIQQIVGVGQYDLLPTPTRKQRSMNSSSHLSSSLDSNLPRRHPSRWVCRRYRNLLPTIPILDYHPNGRLSVEIPPSGHAALDRGSSLRLPAIDEMSSKWYGINSTESKS